MITIGFSTHRGPLAWCIRKVTRSPVSHAFLVLDDPLFQARLVLEATSHGFSLSPLRRWAKRNRIVETVDLVYPLEPGLHAVVRFLGQPYDVGGLFGMPFVLLGRWLKRKWRNPLRSSRMVFCSEAVARVLIGARVPGTEDVDPEAVTPEDLRELLKNPRIVRKMLSVAGPTPRNYA